MQLPPLMLALFAGAALAASEDTTSASTLTVDGTTAVVMNSSSVALPSGSYTTYNSTMTISSQLASISANPGSNATVTSSSQTLTVLGGHRTAAANASSPSASPVVNTQPCNGYPEFCARRYSNITMVTAHNSPFVRPGNIASNQALPVTSQLNDGVRMLQFQVHLQNGTMYLCHTSCALLNAGTLQAYLETVAKWVSQNPYDVVTILMGNFDLVEPGNLTAPILASGLKDYIFTPPQIPMGLDDWPTLSEMIITGKRVLFFMDYNANQKKYPWLMDEFSQMWETPYSPTNPNFPCTEQRPPGLSQEAASKRLYMANHNLNLELSFTGHNILIPDTAQLDRTNADKGFGSIGLMAAHCKEMWNRPPNFLLVDYYNYGNFNGSVFEVAAKMNNVTYNNASCCGLTSAAPRGVSVASATTVLAVAGAVQLLMSAF